MGNIRGIRYLAFGCILVISTSLFLQGCDQHVALASAEKLPSEITVHFAIPPEPEPPLELPPRKQLSDEEILQCYWRWYELLGIKLPPGENKHQMKVSPAMYDEQTWTFTRGVGGVDESENVVSFVDMDLDASTGALYVLFNHAVWDELYKLPAGTQPTKTREVILEEASKYLKLIIGDLADNFRVDHDYSRWESRGGRTDLKGYWWINWYRVMNGYKVDTMGDGINMDIHEEYGLIAFTFSMRSLPCPTEVKITEEQAKKIAATALPIIIQRCPHLCPPMKVKGQKLTECELCIINPYYIFSQGVSSIWTYLNNRHTRLAYRISFWVFGEKENWGYKLVVDVDAATGEIIGGNYTKGEKAQLSSSIETTPK